MLSDIKIQKIHEELETKKRKEERQIKVAESKLKVTIKEVGDLAGEVSQLIKIKQDLNCTFVCYKSYCNV